MIKLVNDYVVAVDSYNYTLQIDLNKIDKNGKKLYKIVGYYGDLKEAIKACVKDMNKRKFEDEECTLMQAVQIINNNSKRFEMILENALKESGVVEQ